MKWVMNRSIWGLLLVALGVLALLVNMSLIPDSAWLWAGAFTLAGLYFLFVFAANRENWWAAFPAFGALGIAGTIVTAETNVLPDEFSGAIFLGATSLAFFAIYFRRPDNWWALIPAGVTLTVAAIVLVSVYERSLPDNIIPVVLFGGLALTFLLVSFTRNEGGRNRWAIWPAAGLLLLALVTGVSAFDLGGYIAPLFLIGIGIFILLRRK
jgi:hypothetical protein